ncbi:hypothetical protein H0H81_007660 [Sphagnurus paluster]|uniref:PARP n=1 Tax=Sphagnurus paluster TaxID=117069 RepID=A0A9P7K8R1_9AGAR|nr:hypothetical protein H0H81_007660 [Sphagnurus paluster]
MALVGSSSFVDFTLDRDEDPVKTSLNNKLNTIVIELSDDDNEEEVNQIHVPRKRVYSKKFKKQFSCNNFLHDELLAKDDEIVILNSSQQPVASSSSAVARTGNVISEDQALAQRLAEEYEEQFPAVATISEDEALARRLAAEDDYSIIYDLAEDEALARRLAQEFEESDLPKPNAEDERLARQLAEEEEQSYRQLVSTIENKEEGIVFSVAVNVADNTLDDGSPAHPDDLERFEPWKLCESIVAPGLTAVHWFVNYELEKRFEAARDMLHQVTGEAFRETRLFHGTACPNIESIGGVGGHRVVNGTAFGCGIYLAANPGVSIGYAVTRFLRVELSSVA